MKLDCQQLPPVTRDQFAQWLDNPVTVHLFQDLETAYMDSALDPLPIDSIDKIAIESIRRETVRAFTDIILDWVPNGAEQEENDIGNQ